MDVKNLLKSLRFLNQVSKHKNCFGPQQEDQIALEAKKNGFFSILGSLERCVLRKKQIPSFTLA